MKKSILLIFLLAAVAWAQAPAGLPLQYGHTGDVALVKWSPDEKSVLSYSAQDGSLLLWEAATGKLLWQSDIKDNDRLACWVWSNDGKLIASGQSDGSIQLWDAQTGSQRWEKPAHAVSVSALAFSPDGQQLASAGQAEKGGEPVKIWNTEDGAAVREIADKGAALVALAWEKSLRGGRITGETATLEAPAGAASFRPCGVKETPEAIGFSRDLSLVAAACGPEKIVLADNAKQLQEWKVEEEPKRAFSFSGDGKWLAAVSLARTVFYPVSSGEARVVPEEQRLGEAAELNRDGSRFVEGGGWGGPRARLGDATTGQTVQMLEAHPGTVYDLAFSPDGTKLATASADRIVRLWNAKTGALLAAWAGHQDFVKSVAWHPDGKTLVSLGEDRTLRLWDVGAGKELRNVDLAQSEGETSARSVEFSPDGQTLLVAGVNAVELWRGVAWETRTTLRADPAPDTTTCGTGEVFTARFSPDGQYIATGCGDKSVKFWQAKDGKLLRSFAVAGEEPEVAFSPDGKIMAVAQPDDAPATLYDTTTGKALRSLDKETSLAYDITFSQDGKALLMSNLSGEITLCNITDGTILRKLTGGLAGNDALAFSPDGKFIATGGANQNVLLWDAASAKLLWSAIQTGPAPVIQ